MSLCWLQMCVDALLQMLVIRLLFVETVYHRSGCRLYHVVLPCTRSFILAMVYRLIEWQTSWIQFLDSSIMVHWVCVCAKTGDKTELVECTLRLERGLLMHTCLLSDVCPWTWIMKDYWILFPSVSYRSKIIWPQNCHCEWQNCDCDNPMLWCKFTL